MMDDLPRGWKKEELGKKLSILSGFAFKSAGFSKNPEDGIPLIRIRDIITQKPDTFFTGKVPLGYEISSGDILIGMDGDFHLRKWQAGKALLNQRICKVSSADPSSLDNDYLYYFLAPELSRIHSGIAATTVKHLSTKHLKTIIANLPPLPEQKKIAEVLSSVDEAIAATKAVIDQTKQVKKGLLQTLLTRGIGHTKFKQTELGEIPESWEVVCLEEIALVERGKFSARPRNDPKYYGGDIPFIQTGDVVSSNGILRKHRQTLNEHGLGVSKRFAAHVVLVTIAANIGDTAITTYPVCCPDSIVAVQPNEGIDVFWLQHILASKKSYLDSVATQNAQKNINLTHLKPLLVALPPFEERENIASILNGLRNTEVDNVETLEQLQTLKRGLMSDLLTGRKRVEVLDA